MSQTPRTFQGGNPGDRPGAQPAGGPAAGGLGAVSIDPIKLAKKYKYLLVVAGVFGVALGVATFFVWRAVAPVYTAQVVFEVKTPETEAGKVDPTQVDDDNMEKQMASVAYRLTDEAFLAQAVSNERRLQRDVPGFYEQYVIKGSFDDQEALEGLMSAISASPQRDTYYVIMRARAGDKATALGLAAFIRKQFEAESTSLARGKVSSKRDGLNAVLGRLRSTHQDFISKRDRLVSETNISSIDASRSEARTSLESVNVELLTIQQDMEAAMVQLERFESMLKPDAAIEYTDQQRAAVEQDPLVQNLRSQIKQLEAERDAMARAVSPGHRSYKALVDRIAAFEQKLTDLREEKLRELFDAELDGLRTAIAQLRAQESELSTKATALREELNELTRILAQYSDYEAEIEKIEQQIADNEAAIGELERQDVDASRVTVASYEREPNQLSAPRIEVVIPGVTFLVTGLVCAVIVLRELLDQRVRSASDIAMISKARVLGVVPIIGEDPTSPSRIETAYNDRPKGVTAESFRQLRTGLLKRMHQSGHRSVLVVSGLPGSGATSVAANLAAATAASDHRTLLIDANFRRPNLHKIMGVKDRPGLGEVLAGDAQLAATVEHTDDANLDVLSAGGPESRVFERLGTGAMSRLLAEAGESYDLIILDVAPAIVSGDALSLASRCDASLLVVRAGAEKRGMVARLRNEFADARAELLGIVVNGVRSAAGGYLRQNIRTAHDYHGGNKKPRREPVESDA